MKIIQLFFLLLLITSCDSAYEDIEFKDIKNVKVKMLSTNKIELTGDCLLYNPNLVGLDLTQADFKVYVGDRKAAEIHQQLDVEMPADTTFTLPLKAVMSPKEFYGKKGSGLLGAALQVLTNEKIKLRYDGSINAGIGAVKLNIPVVDSLEVPVKLFK